MHRGDIARTLWALYKSELWQDLDLILWASNYVEVSPDHAWAEGIVCATTPQEIAEELHALSRDTDQRDGPNWHDVESGFHIMGVLSTSTTREDAIDRIADHVDGSFCTLFMDVEDWFEASRHIDQVQDIARIEPIASTLGTCEKLLKSIHSMAGRAA